MSLVKCGNGYGGYGHGHGKPQMNHHRQNSEHVTTVVTKIRMTVNEKQCYGGGAVQKHASREEEDDHVYARHHGGAVQKYGYGQGTDGGYSRHHGGVTGGVHDYQAAYGGNACKQDFAGGRHAGGGRIHHYKEYESEESDCSEECDDESDCEESDDESDCEESDDDSDCEESDDDSDCEEEFARGRNGGVHREAYKREEKHAGSNRATTRGMSAARSTAAGTTTRRMSAARSTAAGTTTSRMKAPPLRGYSIRRLRRAPNGWLYLV